MIYGSLQAVYVETKHNGHIPRSGTLIRGNIVVYMSKSIENNNHALWSLQTS